MSRFISFIYHLFPRLRFKSSSVDLQFQSKNNIPVHIAVIMDGNGRWAQRRGLPRAAGHKMGSESLRQVVKACAEFGVNYLTVYAFSTENWQRPKEEVDFLMSLLSDVIDKELDELNKNNVKLRFLGGLDKLSGVLQEKIIASMEKTKNNAGLNLNVMINYGGRAEIALAVKSLAEKIVIGSISTVDDICSAIQSYLYTSEIPDPDLLIRTGGDKRISNFLLWQSAYAEFYFTEVFWPDFGRKELVSAIVDFQKRKRRFGRV